MDAVFRIVFRFWFCKN